MKSEGDRQQFAREAAERAQARREEANAGLARLAARKLRRDAALIRREVRQSEDGLAELEREQRGDLRMEDAGDAAFMREQLIPMLKDGWSLDELAGVGITRESLAALGILHHLKH